ncbi:MAG: hypothetical protein AAFX85_01190 [Pseudomonadota bacterium]
MTTRFTSAALVLALAPALAFSAPCDTAEAGVEYMDPPFTQTQLRSTLRQGLEVVMRMESPVAGSFSRRMVVADAGTDSVKMRESTLEEEFRQSMPDSTVDATWGELRDHACFPAASTTRERVTAETAFGELPGWRYVYEKDDVRLVLTFADALPGLPVTYERFQSEIKVLTSRQVSRSDRATVEAEPSSATQTPPGER